MRLIYHLLTILINLVCEINKNVFFFITPSALSNNALLFIKRFLENFVRLTVKNRTPQYFCYFLTIFVLSKIFKNVD